ncbi:ANTAR domain-containing response regulator [Cohnella luojiensis]|uniref:ANTAR domain-containing protein n=1 Tax=Cohnella luojiensis TaxID=652876 RepID=A0A4Y8M8U9_9BACL|nr:ANTAR domain-containing protein [Cohnella luojiensis]TFE31711.1 ANTAR domain-containing protein [Cohnella luojiensis]
MNKPLVWQDSELDPAPIIDLNNTYRNMTLVRAEAELRQTLPLASVAILHVPYAKLREKHIEVINIQRLPILWMCNETRVPKDPDWGYSLDGLLYPGMKRHEVDWALQAAARCCSERKRWHEEKEQLLMRLEERKWIDQAKGILCEIKGITESEAYDFLRKQAMNERKRMGEVASSIVKVYQLIHG